MCIRDSPEDAIDDELGSGLRDFREVLTGGGLVGYFDYHFSVVTVRETAIVEAVDPGSFKPMQSLRARPVSLFQILHYFVCGQRSVDGGGSVLLGMDGYVRQSCDTKRD